MNALNRGKIAHALEEAASKILTILQFDEKTNDNTILCPLITLRALFETNVELIAYLPHFHKTPYYEEVEFRSKKFIEWIKQWPETLTLETIRSNDEFSSMTKKYVKMTFDAHLLARSYGSPASSVWGIEYQTNHVMATHGINKAQRQKIDDVIAELARNQFCRMTEIQRRMAKTLEMKYHHIYSAGPGGLDVPYVYMERKTTINEFVDKTEWKTDQQDAIKKFEFVANGKNPIVSPIIIRIQQEEDIDEDEPPAKLPRRSDTDMMF